MASRQRIFSLGRLVLVQAIIFAAGLVIVELTLRQFLPLPPHGGVYRDSSGGLTGVARDANTLRPRLDIRHVASEYDAHIQTDEMGFRKMSKESLSPDLLFLGDSFTFGHGVSDEEVFSEVLCKKRGATCLNLGRSGTHTFDQVRLLRYAIDAHRVRPRTVVVTMLAACWLGVDGNDLGDNLTFYRATKRSGLDEIPVVRASFAPSVTDAMRTLQRSVSDFEITKRLMMVAARGLKQSFYACSDRADLEAATAATAVALGELAQLAEQYGFQTKVVVIHPLQDVAEQFRAVSEATVNRALPKGADCIPTGARFGPEHYYRFDGHFNASGHANLAAILDAALDGNDPDACASVP